MAVTEKSIFHLQSGIFKALANETRLEIVNRLGTGECSAGELTILAGLDQSTVSKHLSVLKSAGIVADRKEGTTVYYRLLTPCILNFMSCATQVLKEQLEAFKILEED